MKKVLIALALLSTQACSNQNLKCVGSEVIYGKVSAVQHYEYGMYAVVSPSIWVQDSKSTNNSITVTKILK